MSTNWLQLLKNYIGYQGATSLADKLTVVRAGYLDNINNAQLLVVPNLSTLSAARIGYLDNINQAGLLQVTAARAVLLDQITTLRMAELDPANIPADVDTLLARLTALRGGYLDNLSAGAAALEATLTAIKGGGWATETLVAIKAAIDVIGGVNTYQEQIPDTDFNLAAVSLAMATDPPGAPAANSVVDIDQVAGSTFVLRSIWINITSFGTGTLLKFKLWTLVNAVVTKVDEVDVASLGIQNLADIFGLQEVHADGIWITVQCDAGATGACAGTYRYAQAS